MICVITGHYNNLYIPLCFSSILVDDKHMIAIWNASVLTVPVCVLQNREYKLFHYLKRA